MFLLVGFLAGLALGLVLSYREAPRSLEPRVPVVRTAEHAPDSARPREEAPASSITDDAASSPLPILEPTGDLPAEEAEAIAGHGRIEVDFEGFEGEREAWVARTSLDGSREDENGIVDEGQTLVSFDVIPGVCEVWWLLGPRRIGVRVRVVAGRVVRLRAADFDAPLVPRDLAVLGIRVHASWGGSLPFCDVTIEADDESGRWRIDRNGCLSRTLRPGAVRLKVGDQVTPVTLVANRETVLEVAHQGEGDVLFEPPLGGKPGHLYLLPAEGRPFVVHKHYRYAGRTGFVYVKAGDYDVFYKRGRVGAGGTRLGSVRIHPGRASVFRVELPPGVLEVFVELPAEQARRTPYVLVSLQSVVGKSVRFVDQVQGVRAAGEGRQVHRVRIDGLHPGTYRVICGTASETVEVGAGVTDVVLRPPR